MWYSGSYADVWILCVNEMLEKSKRKGGKIPSFANSMGQSCWQSWAFLTSLARFANSFGPSCWQS
jgi:hypothetical protein